MVSNETIDDIPEEQEVEVDILDNTCFNINNYLHVLATNERKNYEEVLKKIPKDRHAYI